MTTEQLDPAEQVVFDSIMERLSRRPDYGGIIQNDAKMCSLLIRGAGMGDVYEETGDGQPGTANLICRELPHHWMAAIYCYWHSAPEENGPVVFLCPKTIIPTLPDFQGLIMDRMTTPKRPLQSISLN